MASLPTKIEWQEKLKSNSFPINLIEELTKNGWDDPNFFHQINEQDLIAMNFKKGHIAKFKAIMIELGLNTKEMADIAIKTNDIAIDHIGGDGVRTAYALYEIGKYDSSELRLKKFETYMERNSVVKYMRKELKDPVAFNTTSGGAVLGTIGAVGGAGLVSKGIITGGTVFGAPGAVIGGLIGAVIGGAVGGGIGYAVSDQKAKLKQFDEMYIKHLLKAKVAFNIMKMEENQITQKVLSTEYKRQALVFHPDRSGYDSKQQFQTLTEQYVLLLGKYAPKSCQSGDDVLKQISKSLS